MCKKNNFNKNKIYLIGLIILPIFSIFIINALPISGQTIVGNFGNLNSPAPTNNSSIVLRSTYAEVVDRVSPAVVAIRSERRGSNVRMENPLANDPLFREFFGNRLPQDRPQVQRGIGSGVIVESNGTILTNNHVVEGATTVKVDLPDKRSFTAKVVGTDPASDLAVLKIEAKNLPILQLGDSEKVRVGDVVLAVGNPLGLRQTVTKGIISAKGRQTGISDGSFEDFLQTDAPINQGNSGGALVNLNGEVIGINSQILSPSGGNIGIGFSIPSNMAKSVMTQLIKDGKVRRGMLGVGIQDVTNEIAESFGLKEIRGVIVNSVSPSSPAEKAGIKQGDVILSLNGSIVSDGNELRNRVSSTAPNSTVTVGILRDGKEQNINVVLAELQTNDDGKTLKHDTEKGVEQGKLGVTLQPVTPQLSQQMRLRNVTEGLVVTEVQNDSPADIAGITSGDVILQINRQQVKTLDEVQNAISQVKNNSVLLLVNRMGRNFFASVNIGKK